MAALRAQGSVTGPFPRRTLRAKGCQSNRNLETRVRADPRSSRSVPRRTHRLRGRDVSVVHQADGPQATQIWVMTYLTHPQGWSDCSPRRTVDRRVSDDQCVPAAQEDVRRLNIGQPGDADTLDVSCVVLPDALIHYGRSAARGQKDNQIRVVLSRNGHAAHGRAPLRQNPT